MRIGLIRHFKVDLLRKNFMTSDEYREYNREYDKAEVIKNEIIINESWDKCYCSSLPRAIITAKTLYDGEIIISDKLVEIPAMAVIKLAIPLPYYAWSLLSRVAWGRNHASQPEGRLESLKRINYFIDYILENEKDSNILIVSHAGALYEMRKILINKGFTGDWFLKPRNGKLYILKK
ncbi:histidine phosphatase family protein [Clostridium rectalis]|uniref:histidine phosphatase family protein n=1 Tax=Clostridium rectalis TaxID=2040295 RepID=UPI000F63DA3E|nr:histidine phosphatase family protein [Clostridium rectalis]